MTPVVRYFEIPVSNMPRAIAFYQAVFPITLEPAEVDGNQMAFFPADPENSGATGALACGESYVPGTQGCRVYFAVTDIMAVLDRAVAAGGRVLYPKTSIGEHGFVAEFADSEGNCIALHRAGG